MKVILTEAQIKDLIFEERFSAVCGILEGTERSAARSIIKKLAGVESATVIFRTLAKYLKRGTITMVAVPLILGMLLGSGLERAGVREKIMNGLETVWEKVKSGDEEVTTQMQADAEEQADVWKNKFGNWKLVSDDTIATVYNAVPSQCNNDVIHTASMFKLNLGNVLSQRVIAMERTFMKELGLKYGDVVYVEGTEKWDGPWQIQDTMNKRFAGMHKIDILVPRNIRTGKWSGVKISVPADKETEAKAKSVMKGSV